MRIEQARLAQDFRIPVGKAHHAAIKRFASARRDDTQAFALLIHLNRALFAVVVGARSETGKTVATPAFARIMHVAIGVDEQHLHLKPRVGGEFALGAFVTQHKVMVADGGVVEEHLKLPSLGIRESGDAAQHQQRPEREPDRVVHAFVHRGTPGKNALVLAM